MLKFIDLTGLLMMVRSANKIFIVIRSRNDTYDIFINIKDGKEVYIDELGE